MKFYGPTFVNVAGLDAFATTLTSSLTTTVASTATTLAASGLTVALAASGTYRITAIVIFQAASTTTGLKLQAQQTHISAGGMLVRVPNTNTAAATAIEQWGNGNVSVTGNNATTASVNMYAVVEGVITQDSSGGNLVINFASTTAGQSITLQAGSLLVAERLA